MRSIRSLNTKTPGRQGLGAWSNSGNGSSQRTLAQMADLFLPSPTVSDMAIVYSTPGGGGDVYDLYQRIDNTFYSRWTLGEARSVRYIRLAYCDVKVPATDASVVRAGGGWTGPIAGAGLDPPPLGNYYRTATAGATVTYTTPDSVSIIGCTLNAVTNAGIFLVTIDGDTTKANLCKTAQQLVDSGVVGNTILVTNGGTLNPTDRVVDSRIYSINERIFLADNLTPGVHTVVLTCTGYKNSTSTDVRLYNGGFVYGGPGINTATANSELMSSRYYPNYLNDDSVLEYALSTTITNNSWVGNGHGNETTNSLTFFLDSVETALVTEYLPYQATSELKVVRATTLNHPDQAGIGTGLLNYIFTPNSGLKVSLEIDWLHTITIGTGYMPMLAFVDAIDKASFYGAVNDWSLAGDPGNNTDYASVESQLGYGWDADGTIGLAVYVPALASLDNWQYSLNLAYAQDRSGGLLNKLYFTRWNGKIFNNGDSITSEFVYQLKHFPGGANATLAR